jgi:hypothetical protein
VAAIRTESVLHASAGSDDLVRDGMQAVSDLLVSLNEKVRDPHTQVGCLAARFEGRHGRSSGSTVTDVLRPNSPTPTDGGFGVDEEYQLRLFCLGPFEVYLVGESIPLRRLSKGRTILQFLASRPRQPVHLASCSRPFGPMKTRTSPMTGSGWQ